MFKNAVSYFRLNNIGLTLVVILVYYILVRGGMLVTSQPATILPVWPISGIALAAILLIGRKAIPGLFIGNILTNIIVFNTYQITDLTTSIWMSALIAIGFIAEMLVGYSLLKRIPERIISFEKIKYVFAFVFSVLVMCLFDATVGVIASCLAGVSSWYHFPSSWFAWWLCNVSAILVAVPLILTFTKYFKSKWTIKRKLEIAVLFLLIFFIAGTIFAEWLNVDPTFIKPYLVLPPLLWAAFRFGQLETVIAISVTAGISIWQTMHGRGPFSGSDLQVAFVSSQMYVSIISVTILAMRAAICEREESEKALQIAHNELAGIVSKRTEKLDDYQKRIENIFSAILKYTMLDFSQTVPISDKGDEIDAIAAGLNTLSEELKVRIQKLQQSEERFRMLVESVKDYAIFRVDKDGYILSWNKGAEHIKGYSADEIIGKHISTFYTPEELERSEPERNLRLAKERGRYESEGWRKRKDGSEFWADVVLTAIYDDNKNVIGFVKVTRDITARKRLKRD
jgi:PAS domain S-box-containing protein